MSKDELAISCQSLLDALDTEKKESKPVSWAWKHPFHGDKTPKPVWDTWNRVWILP